MAFHNLLLLVALAVVGQPGGPTTVASDSEQVACIGTKAIGDTVAIVTDRKTGFREQSLVEARLAIVLRGNVIGTVYVDDEGMRYIETKRGAIVPGLAETYGNGAVHPLEMQQIFGGEARLRACKPDSQ